MTPAIHERIKEITTDRDIIIMYSTGKPQTTRVRTCCCDVHVDEHIHFYKHDHVFACQQINETILTVFERFITENADRMEDLFLQMDKDKSGDITLEEFKYGLKDFGLRLTSVRIDLTENRLQLRMELKIQLGFECLETT